MQPIEAVFGMPPMIPRTLSALLFSMLLLPSLCRPQAGVSPDLCPQAVSTVAMIECLQERYRRLDGELNQAYKQLLSSLPPHRQDLLTAAQRAWIAFRDRSAELEASGETGGTLEPVVRLGALVTLTQERIAQLDGLARKLH